MYQIYGRKIGKDDDYVMISNQIIDCWHKAERLCYELESTYRDYFFESREVKETATKLMK